MEFHFFIFEFSFLNNLNLDIFPLPTQQKMKLATFHERGHWQIKITPQKVLNPVFTEYACISSVNSFENFFL